MTEQLDLCGVEGLRLVADVYGPADGPPALLLHGFGQTRQSWGRAAAELGVQGWRAYAVDQRGHGDSDRSIIAAYRYADFSADVLAFCQTVKERPLVIGASMGGIAALVAQGTSEPQLYRGLVLVDITPDIDMDGARRIISFMSASPDGYADLDEAVEAIAAYRGPGRAGPQRMVLPGCSGKAPTAAGAGTGIPACSMREGLGSPTRRRPPHIESGCGQA